MKIQLLMLGKTRRPEMRALVEDYVKRLRHSCPVEVAEARDADAVLKRLDADRAATALLLDAAGKAYDSQALAEWLGKQRDQGTREIIFVCGDAEGFPEALRQLQGTREIIFVCGDAEGFPEALRQRVPRKISLSPMTFSHELARVMLAEQLYRAFAILSGSPYPK